MPGILYNAPLAAGEAHIGFVGLTSQEIVATITRPSDTPGAYSAKDVISDSTSAPTVLNFENCARINGGCGAITKARLFTNSATALLGAVVRLHLYHTAPTAINDHAQFALLWANRASRVGYIDFPALTTEGTGSDSAYSLWVDLPVAFCAAAADRDLYGIAELTTAGAAPASGQILYFALTVDQA